MKISLIVTTYNAPEMLRLCLSSILTQTRTPDEVVIADDGSTDDTRQLIKKFADRFPCPLKHAWQEDRGFRAAESRNNALRQCEGDYVVFIDGDVILERHFIADHERLAEKGYFIVGSRTKLSPSATRRIINTRNAKLHWYSRGVKSRLNAMYMPMLTPWSEKAYGSNLTKGRSVNMAAFLSDLKTVNGFDSGMVGYGLEDTDIIIRLVNLGLKRKWAKFQAIEYHLYHKEGTFEKSNRILLERNNRRVACSNGIVKIDEEK